MKRLLSLYTMLLLCCVTLWAQAPLDRREVRSGNRDFRKGDYKEADIDYRRALVKDSTSITANYNLANTLYKMENYQEAAKYAQTAEDSACESASPKAADVHFNKGDIALQNKDYNTALEAFKRSLLLNPGDLDAKENYIYAKKMLEDQQQNGGGQGQNDQNQDQNQDQKQNQDQNQNNDQNNDQNQDQNKNNDQNNNQDQNQNGDQNRDQNQNKDQSGQQPQMTPQAAQQMLQAIEAKEKETQDKVKKEKALQAKSRQKEKNW